MQGRELGRDARGFRDAHHDVLEIAFAKTRTGDLNRVGRYRQERSAEVSVRVGLQSTGDLCRVLVDDLDFRSGDDCARNWTLPLMAPVAPPWAAAIAGSTRTTRNALANFFSLDSILRKTPSP